MQFAARFGKKRMERVRNGGNVAESFAPVKAREFVAFVGKLIEKLFDEG